MVEDNVLEKAQSQAKLGDFDETPKEEPKVETPKAPEAPKPEPVEPKPVKAPEVPKEAPKEAPKPETKEEPGTLHYDGKKAPDLLPEKPPAPKEPMRQVEMRMRGTAPQGYQTPPNKAANIARQLGAKDLDDAKLRAAMGMLTDEQQKRLKNFLRTDARRQKQYVRNLKAEEKDKMNELSRIDERGRGMDAASTPGDTRDMERPGEAPAMPEKKEGENMGEKDMNKSNQTMRSVLDVEFPTESKHHAIRVVGDYGDEAKGEDLAVDPVGWRSVRLGDGKEAVMPSRIRVISYKD